MATTLTLKYVLARLTTEGELYEKLPSSACGGSRAATAV